MPSDLRTLAREREHRLLRVGELADAPRPVAERVLEPRPERELEGIDGHFVVLLVGLLYLRG